MPEKKNPLSLDPEKTKRRGYFLINMAYFAFWAAIAILVVRYLFAWMVPFVLGFLVAFLLQHPVKWLVRKTKISKKIFSVALVVLIVLLLAGLVFIIGWRLVVFLISFFSKENIEVLQTTLTGFFGDLRQSISNLSASLSPSLMDSINSGLESLSGNLISLLTGALSNVATFAVTLTTKLPSLLVSFIVWVLSSIFLSIDFDMVTSFFSRQVPPQHKPMLHAVKAFCGTALFGLGRAYLLLMCVTFVELSIGLSVLGIPYAIPLAVLIAIIDILPVLGTGTVLIPWALISLILGNFRLFIGLGLLYVLITVIRNILEPKVVSGQIGLHPVITLFFMLLGLRAMGVLGMFLFPIAIIILKQLHDGGYVRLWK